MYRLHGAIHAYGGTTVSARDTADSVITALSPAAWYRNATGVTEAGGFASQWDDYSGNARHLVQATGTNQPAYAAGVFDFDGGDNFMKTSAFTLNQSWSAVIVIQPDAYTSGTYFFDGNTSNVAVLYQTGVTPSVSIYAGAATAANTGFAIGAYAIGCAVFAGASSSLRVNNAAKTTGNAGVANAAGFTLGSNGAGTGAWSNIKVKECVLFPTALSDANQDAVITALNNALTVF